MLRPVSLLLTTLVISASLVKGDCNSDYLACKDAASTRQTTCNSKATSACDSAFNSASCPPTQTCINFGPPIGISCLPSGGPDPACIINALQQRQACYATISASPTGQLCASTFSNDINTCSTTQSTCLAQPGFCASTYQDCQAGTRTTYLCCVAGLSDPSSSSCEDQRTASLSKCSDAYLITQNTPGTPDCDSIFASVTGISKDAAVNYVNSCTQPSQQQLLSYQASHPGVQVKMRRRSAENMEIKAKSKGRRTKTIRPARAALKRD